MTTKAPRTAALDDEKARRLQLAVRASGWWMLAWGGLDLVMGRELALHLGLRFDPLLTPYVRDAALGRLVAGIWVLRALKEPRRQYLAVDLLILHQLASVYFLLAQQLEYRDLSPLEWARVAVELGLGVALVMHRTSAKQQDGEPLLAYAPIQEGWRWALRRLGKEPATAGAKPDAPVAAPAATPAPIAAPAPPPAPAAAAPSAEPSPPSKRSEALPHLD